MSSAGRGAGARAGAAEAPATDPRPSALPASLRARHQLSRALRSFFDGAGFVEVETPIAVASPGLELHLDAFEVRGLPERRWLQTSPEYHMKRLLAAGMTEIYQICKVFRRDEQGSLHEPEFTMLEWYRAQAGSQEMMQDTEQLVAHAARALLGTTRIPALRDSVDVEPPWEQLTVREAFERYASTPYEALLEDDEAFYRALAFEVEPQLGRGRPTFLTRYPARMAALARLCPDDPSVADRFEAYIDGVELCNAFGELVDASEQRRRLERDAAERARLGKDTYPIDERFLSALEWGLPPCGGNALGVDRLAMLLLGTGDIQGVLAFASDRV